MACILKRGESYRALVRRKGFKTQCKTFPKKALAEAWARQVEADMDNGLLTAGQQHSKMTVSQLIEVYRDMRAKSGRPISRLSNEHYVINRLDEELGEYMAVALTPDVLVGYCRTRADDGVIPATTNTEISKLSTVLRYAAAAKNIVLPDVVRGARPLLLHLGLIGAAVKRERRAEGDELERVLGQMMLTYAAVYAEAAEFGVHSTLRRGEVCRILKADVDVEKRLVLVRDRKHPRSKKGNDEWIPLLGRAWDIVCHRLEQDREDPRLFPVAAGTVSKYWRSACLIQGISDLRLHDLRHEGTSRLFEEGYAIQEVAMVTGHKDWRNLRRYTNLRPEDLHKIAAAKKPARKKPARKRTDKLAVFET